MDNDRITPARGGQLSQQLTKNSVVCSDTAERKVLATLLYFALFNAKPQ